MCDSQHLVHLKIIFIFRSVKFKRLTEQKHRIIDDTTN